jgi:hypothetical protein
MLHSVISSRQSLCVSILVAFVLGINGFVDPIIVPGRKPLVTLSDAAHYIMQLPKVEQRATALRSANECTVI